MKNIFSLLKELIGNKFMSNDDNRRIYILRILIIGSLVLATAAFILALGDELSKGSNYRGMHLLPLLVPSIYFFGLFCLTNTRHYKIASYLMVGFYFLCATYAIYAWGFVLPTGLLIYGLITIMAGIIIDTTSAVIISIINAITIILIAYLQAIYVLKPDLYWINDLIGVDDALVYIFILGVITAVAWLSNREIDKSLQRARESEAALIVERDQLEIKVEERTRELRQTQNEQMAQLYRFAELGQMSAGILHDIANPLTTVSLNLEQLESEERSQLVKRARLGIKQMQEFITAARRKLQSESVRNDFSAAVETRTTLSLLNYRLKKEGISLQLIEEAKLRLHGNEVKFQQLMTNLISNAIDAYRDMPDANRRIVIYIKAQSIIIQDFGHGIKRNDLKKIFEPFYSTKTESGGMGLGLAICRDIMQKEFDGTLQVSSQRAVGTCFTLHFART
jgi:signal transduction histidine kinase